MNIDEQQLNEWMEKSLKGDTKAYTKLLEAASTLARPFVIKRVGAENAEDIVQEILVSLHQARPTFQKGHPFKPWFYAICRFRVMDHLRKHYRHQEHEVEMDVSIFEGETTSDVTEQVANHEEVNKALSVLSDKQKRIVILMKVEGYSASEVALKMNMSISAVKVTAHRAYSKMRKHLESL